MKISFVISTRNNLKYLKWSYDSIRKNQGNHEVWLCYGIDHCTDGTQEWIEEIKKTDPFVKSIENKTGKRLGHTVMYDKVIYELVETDLAMIFHSDMYLCNGSLDEVENLMYIQISKSDRVFWYNQKYKTSETDISNNILDNAKVPRYISIKNQIVSLTRIEPPLWEPSPEKIIMNFGYEPEDFDETGLSAQLHVFSKLNSWKQTTSKGFEFEIPLKGTTSGVFAPWVFWVDEFKEIDGHDWANFAPQSKEDSDFFNRYKLKFGDNCFKQIRNGYVYHLCCRGSRRNPELTDVNRDSDEWSIQNMKSTRNFIRKWGHFVQHDEWLNPIIPHKFNIGFKLNNARFDLLQVLEPWCDEIYCDFLENDNRILDRYIELEQPNTKFNLTERVKSNSLDTEIIVQIDGNNFTEGDWRLIQNLSEIINDSGQIGEFEIGNLKVTIKAMNHYENDLIVCKNEPIELK